jgi:hypothetical protein
MARSSLFGWIVTYASLIPFIGETVMRLRNFLIMRAVLRGGVAEAKSIPPALLKEMYLVGIAQAITALFSACSATRRAGRPQPRIMAASIFRSCSFGGIGIGQGRRSASMMAS